MNSGSFRAVPEHLRSARTVHVKRYDSDHLGTRLELPVHGIASCEWARMLGTNFSDGCRKTMSFVSLSSPAPAPGRHTGTALGHEKVRPSDIIIEVLR